MPTAPFVLLVELDRASMRGSAFDLHQRKIGQASRRLPAGSEAALTAICSLVEDTADRAGLAAPDALAVEVRPPRSERGARHLDWQRVPLRAELERRLGVPVLIR